MTKKVLDLLVKESYAGDDLDPKKVERIAAALRRFELKQYIRALKMNEQRRTVTLTAAFPLGKPDVEDIKKLYPDKNIVTNVDPSLLIGMRIVDNDTIYELNLSDNLKNMHQYIQE